VPRPTVKTDTSKTVIIVPYIPVQQAAVLRKNPRPLTTAILINLTTTKAVTVRRIPVLPPRNTPVRIFPATMLSAVMENTVTHIGAQPKAVPTKSFPIQTIVIIAFAHSVAITEFPVDTTVQIILVSLVVVPMYGSQAPSTVTYTRARPTTARTSILTEEIIAKTTPARLTDVRIQDYSTVIAIVTAHKIITTGTVKL